jgi:CBS domain-containing protein
VLAEILDTSRPTVGPTSTLEDAIRLMERADVGRLAVLDGATFIGVVTAAGIVGLGHILDETIDDRG